MAFKVYIEDSQVVIEPTISGGFGIRSYASRWPINNELTATVVNTSNIKITQSSGADVVNELAYTQFQDKSGTALGASASATATALNALFETFPADNFLVKDPNSDNSGTTKIRHKADSGGEDRDVGGTLELDLHSASIGLYGSYLKITEDDLNNTSGKNSAYGRLQVYLENAGTPVEVLDIAMGNLVQAPTVDLNTSSLDVSGDVTFSSVAGTVTFSGDTSGIAYADISGTPTIPSNVSDLTNDSGFITAANSLEGQVIDFFTSSTTLNQTGYEGEVIKIGNASSMSFGQLRYMSAAGSPLTARWANADASAASTSSGFLGFALGTSSTTDGMLTRGYVAHSNSYTPGAILYVSKTAGGITDDVSAYTTGNIVRIVGYAVNSGFIYFNPSTDFIEID